MTNETELNNMSQNKLKVLGIRMISIFGKRIDEHSEKFYKELKI